MSLSNIYTSDSFWREAIRDIGKPTKALDFERFNLINRACQITQGLMADVVSESYMTDAVLSSSSTGKYGATGSFVGSTGVLTATMDSVFATGDIGNMIVFRELTEGLVYWGTIISRTSNTVVVVSGPNLPATSISIINVTMLPTTQSGSPINIGGYKILRAGNQVNLQLLSTATKQVVPFLKEGFTRFISTDPIYSDTIIWMIVGQYLWINKGCSSYGTLTLRYPRVCNVLTVGSDAIDLLDGSMVQVGIMFLKGMILKRLGEDPAIDKNAIADQVSSVYRSLGGTEKKEEVITKIEALV